AERNPGCFERDRGLADQADRDVRPLGEVHVECRGQIARRHRHHQTGVAESRDDVQGVCPRGRDIRGDVGLLVDLAIVHRDDHPVTLKSFAEYEMERMFLLRLFPGLAEPWRSCHPYLSSAQPLLRRQLTGPARFLGLAGGPRAAAEPIFLKLQVDGPAAKVLLTNYWGRS